MSNIGFLRSSTSTSTPGTNDLRPHIESRKRKRRDTEVSKPPRKRRKEGLEELDKKDMKELDKKELKEVDKKDMLLGLMDKFFDTYNS